MKKLILFLVLSFIIFKVLGQHSVLNYPGGTISGNVTWNSYDTIYITGNITITNGGSLSISPNTSGSDIGTYLVFLGNYGIFVYGTGSLIINGTEVENIYLTADRAEEGHSKGDKIFGEEGETWNNVLFDDSNGNSIINYTIIEFGRGDDYYCGGGVDIYGNNITIQNTTIQNCSADDGGGIYIYPTGSNITLDNLKIFNNTATNCGGGIYIYGNITLSNCEIKENNGNSGDGIYINSTSTSCSILNSLIYDNNGSGIDSNGSNLAVVNSIIYGNETGIIFRGSGYIVNSNIVNNTTGIYSYTTASTPLIINCIVWGNQYKYTLGTSAKLLFSYSGIEGGISGNEDGGNNVELSSENTADTGPNFANPSAHDYHINSWISPLVDNGTSSYTGVNIPTTDKDNHSVFGIEGTEKDIGAYEFLYFIWNGTTSTDWNNIDNWQGWHTVIPNTISENKVIIPAGCTYYPTASSLTLSNRSWLEIAPTAGLTITGATTVNSGCTFLIKSDANGSGNFITGSSVTGNFTVQLFLAGGGAPDYKWHYVTSPVDNYTKDALTTAINNPYNLLKYDEPKVVNDKNTGWQWHDGYNSTEAFYYLYTGKGYNVYVSSDKTASFVGTIKNGYNASLGNFITKNGTGDDSQTGWNLIGNPFTCGVNADNFNIILVDKVLYFTKDNSYATYDTYTKQGTNGGTNYIPPLQGFFVHKTSTSRSTFTIPSSSRVYSSSQIFKGSESPEEYPLLKFNIADGTTFTDESLIYFFKDATPEFDTLYDAYKLFSKNTLRPQIYTLSNNIELCMNGLPYPETVTEVPLKIKIGEAKNYTFNVLKCNNLNDYNVYLIHGVNKINLKTNPSYTFYAETGITNMVIAFENVLTAISNTLQTESNELYCWYNNEKLFLKINSQFIENKISLTLYDFNGRIIYSKNNLTTDKNEILEIPLKLENGFYILTVKNSVRKYSKKLVVIR